MKRTILLGVLCLGGFGIMLSANETPPPATKPADKLVFPNSGFAIAPLEQPAKGINQVLFMFLPASEGFAPNVNVQTQTHAGTLEEYGAMSEKQFKDGKLEVLSTKNLDKDTVAWEYSGQMQGRALHWYAKAVLKDGTVYLVTATATEGQWKDVSEKLKACVDSLELLPGKQKP